MIGYEGHCHLVEDECSKCTMLGANMKFCVEQTEQEFNLTIQFPEGSIFDLAQSPRGGISIETMTIKKMHPTLQVEF